MPKVTVIMSVYQESVEWIKQSIDSILNQSFGDLEFIIVNDKPDRSENALLLKEYELADSRVCVITNNSNLGLTKSLNKALEIAQGEYIARMDADDISSPDRIELQVSFLDSHPDICVVGGWMGTIDEDGNTIDGVIRYETDPIWVKALFLQNSQVGHPSAMFRRVVNKWPVRYDESIRFAQDYSLWISLLPYGGIANLPQILLFYRISDHQTVPGYQKEQQRFAGMAQKRAFSLFGFPVTDLFLDTYFTMTIQHHMDFPLERVKNDFRSFFKGVRITRENSLALELVYSTFIAYFRNNSRGSLIASYGRVLVNSDFKMIMIGFRLCYHILCKKLQASKLTA